MVKKKVLVTGAAGYIAQTFLKELADQKWVKEIIGLDKNSPKNPLKNVTYHCCDMLSDKWSLQIKKEKADILVHLAYVVAPMYDKDKMHMINAKGTKITMEAAKESALSMAESRKK